MIVYSPDASVSPTSESTNQVPAGLMSAAVRVSNTEVSAADLIVIRASVIGGYGEEDSVTFTVRSTGLNNVRVTDWVSAGADVDQIRLAVEVGLIDVPAAAGDVTARGAQPDRVLLAGRQRGQVGEELAGYTCCPCVDGQVGVDDEHRRPVRVRGADADGLVLLEIHDEVGEALGGGDIGRRDDRVEGERITRLVQRA